MWITKKTPKTPTHQPTALTEIDAKDIGQVFGCGTNNTGVMSTGAKLSYRSLSIIDITSPDPPPLPGK